MNGSRTGEPKLIFPGLAGFYEAVSDLWYPLIRITAGLLLVPAGAQHVKLGLTAFAGGMAKNGFPLPTACAAIVILLETIGGAAVALGLFTRFFAAGVAIQMAVITFVVQMPRGFDRMEFPLLWGIVMFAIALRGGGPYSLDRKIGKEL